MLELYKPIGVKMQNTKRRIRKQEETKLIEIFMEYPCKLLMTFAADSVKVESGIFRLKLWCRCHLHHIKQTCYLSNSHTCRAVSS